MIGMVLAGAALGASFFGLVLLLAPPKVSALVQLGRFDAQMTRSSMPDAAPRLAATGLQTRLGRRLETALLRRGIEYTTLRQDVALTGQSFDAVAGRKLFGAFAGGMLALAVAVTLRWTAGITLPAGSLLLLVAVLAMVLFMIPDLDARRQATARRRDFRRTLSAYLDLVALEMAGSAAPAEALPSAARVGSGWSLELIRDALYNANLAGRNQWDALGQLGARIGVDELRELGALVELVGRDGARVRQTLTARAASMRRRDLAEIEGHAGQRDQSMLLAQVLIGFGFFVFLGYPAVVSLLAL